MRLTVPPSRLRTILLDHLPKPHSITLARCVLRMTSVLYTVVLGSFALGGCDLFVQDLPSTPPHPDEFRNNVAVVLFVILTVLYVIQFWLAWTKTQTAIEGPTSTTEANTEAHEKDSEQQTRTLRSYLKQYEGGLRRNAWVFCILAVLLPIFLNSSSALNKLVNYEMPPQVLGARLADSPEIQELLRSLEEALARKARERTTIVDSISSQEASNSRFVVDALQDFESPQRESAAPLFIGLRERLQLQSIAMQDNLTSLQLLDTDLFTEIQVILLSLASSEVHVEQDTYKPWPEWLYYVCLALIGVLITLEFSYLHTLRRSAAAWIPMLLSALVLDLITLLVFIFVIGNPHFWQPTYPAILHTSFVLDCDTLRFPIQRAHSDLREGGRGFP